MDPSRLFTTVSLLLLLADPLFELSVGLYDFMSAVGCIQRIEVYLSSAPHVEQRTFPRSSETGGSDKTQILKGEAQEPDQVPSKSTEIDDNCISIQSGSFGWNEEAKLKNININISASEIVFLLGPVACGKSTLLKALLGETPLFAGSVTLATAEIAFCDQSPWLMAS
jgi:ATP-binding cassette subfamily C (CFTR/MRP) protein 1